MHSEAASAWTLDELAARAALALSGAPHQASGRVREVPDLRSIRYYATLGLIDKPAAFRGRTALYGRRHLEQLVAIKRLQAQGQPLAQVQRTLSRMDEHELQRLASVPHAALVEPSHAHAHATHMEPSAPARASFWSEAPAEIAQAEASLKEPHLASLPLDARALLVVHGARELTEGDVEAIRAAAAPLLKLLKLRGLLGPHDPEES